MEGLGIALRRLKCEWQILRQFLVRNIADSTELNVPPAFTSALQKPVSVFDFCTVTKLNRNVFLVRKDAAKLNT